MMKSIITLILTLGFVFGEAPPKIFVPNHVVKTDSNIGQYVELAEHSEVEINCIGDNHEQTEIIYPAMRQHRHFSRESFGRRTFDNDTTLFIYDALKKDTGTYTCRYPSNTLKNDTIHVFVHGSSIFVPLSTSDLKFQRGEITIPCKTTKFVNTNDVELYDTNQSSFKISSKKFDMRYGFKLAHSAFDHKLLRDVPFSCRYKNDTEQTMDFSISEIRDQKRNYKYKFYWEKSMEWPYVGLNYNLTCRLDFFGNNYPLYSHELKGECPQCSTNVTSRAYSKRNYFQWQSIFMDITVNPMQLEDGGTYRCIWSTDDEEDLIIEKEIRIAPQKAQVNVIEQSTPVLHLKEGESFTLWANFSFYPMGTNTEAKWKRVYDFGGLQKVSIPEHGTFVEDGFYGLVMQNKNVTTDMSGMYILSVYHFGTEKSVTWNVTIESEKSDVQLFVPASSNQFLKTSIYRPSSNILIDCVAVSIPPADVVFEKKIKGEGFFTRIDPTDLIRLAGTFENGFTWNATVTDDMEVRCSSKQNGQVVSKTQSIIVADEAPQILGTILKSNEATETESNEEIYEGDDVKLSCVVPKGSDWIVFWKFGDNFLNHSTVFEGRSRKSILYLRNVTANLTGDYKCVIKSLNSESGEEVSETIETHVSVVRTLKPYFKNPTAPQIIFSKYDETVSLDCNLDGVPTPKYSWYKNREEFLNGEFNGSVLTIPRATDDENGEFHCLATNRAGSTGNTIQLAVEASEKESPTLLIFLIGFLVFLFLVLVIGICIGLYKLVVSCFSKEKHNNLSKVPLERYGSEDSRQFLIPSIPSLQSSIDEESDYVSDGNQEFFISMDKLELKDELGEGFYGKVVSGLLSMANPKSEIDKARRLKVAVKTAKLPYDPVQQQITKEEFESMREVGRAGCHPNVLALLGLAVDETRGGQLFLVTEFAMHGDLLSYLQRHKPDNNYESTLSTSDLVSFSYQIASGMEYLASKRFVHRDLAISNVLVTNNRTIRIADFGLSKPFNGETYYRIVSKFKKFRPLWSSPEAFAEEKFTEASDVWSFGVCLFEIFTYGGIKPYEDMAQKMRTGMSEKPAYCPDEIFHNLMLETWKENPSERPTFRQCAEWLQQYMAENDSDLLAHVYKMLSKEAEEQLMLKEWVQKPGPGSAGNFIKSSRRNKSQECHVGL